MASYELDECSVCRALFRKHADLVVHLKSSPGCKTSPKKHNPHAFTLESGSHSFTSLVYSKTVPDTAIPYKTRSLSKTVYSFDEPTLDDATLVAAMEAGMKKKTKSRTSGLETSILSTIAEGDDELVTAYRRLTVDPSTGTKRISKEIIGSVTNKAKINIDRVAAVVSRAQNVSVCFLLDTTGSMSSYITGVKEQIIDIVERVIASGCGIEGLAFVGYKDWCDGENHFEILPFTKSIADFKSFVATIRATGGGDAPEDVLGGLYKAISLPWPQKSGTRIIFHLGDAPPHGKETFHGHHMDSYANGHPSDPPLKELFQGLLQKEIMYYFGRINGECDKMISVFEKYYGQKIDKMDSTKPTSISRAVTESVMKSVSVTCRTTGRSSTLGSKELRKFILDEKEPDWSKLSRVDGTILSFNLPESIKDITSFARMEDKIRKCNLQIAPNPFAKGSVRLAYYGKIFYSSKDDKSSPTSWKKGVESDDVVFKEMISLPKVPDLDRQRYMTDLEVQTVAAKLAFEFNGRLCRTSQNPNIKTKFLMAKVVRIYKTGGASAKCPRFLVYEKRFRSDSSTIMIKYTNNMDFVLDPSTLDEKGRKKLELAVAFSHFSYDVTGGYLLVCDLQGVSTTDKNGKDTLLLTDPAIHCAKHLRFGKTNLGSLGMQRFFKRHVCNKYCKALGLEMPSNK